MTIAILDYNAGNTKSVSFALRRLGKESVVTADERVLRSAQRVIVPGVGAAGAAMSYLKERGLDTILRSLTQPVLGICLGQQIFCAYSEEDNTECLGIFPLEARRFRKAKTVPHMGWNLLSERSGRLFVELPTESYAYFVHSYFVPVSEDTVAISCHGERFSAALQRENFYATQFHPERSGRIGELILKNFLEV